MGESAIQFPVADNEGSLVWADDLAASGARPTGLTCVGCGSSVILRAGAKNRPHFAHRVESACASGETVLHRTTVRTLAESIRSAASLAQPFEVFTRCERCQSHRVANLARPGCTITVDGMFDGGVRPDLLVRQASGTPLAAIEVIVTHAPEPETWALYQAKDLSVICVWPTWDTLPLMRLGLQEHLYRSSERAAGCFEVSPCRFPRHHTGGTVPCPDCAAPAHLLSVERATTSCYRCRKSFRMIDIVDCTHDHLVLIAAGCPDLPGVKKLAAELGVAMDVHYSRSAGGEYLMHLCPHCRAIQGDNFLYRPTEAVTDTSLETLPMTLCSAGHLCRKTPIRWPSNSTAERPDRVDGLVGERAVTLHGRRTPPGASVVVVDRSNQRAVVRHMMGVNQ